MIKFFRTIIPRTSLHCWYFRARGQRPHVRVRVAWRHRLHCASRDPVFYIIPLSVLQALSDPWRATNKTIIESDHHSVARRRFLLRGMANYRKLPRLGRRTERCHFLGGGARCRREANSRSDRMTRPNNQVWSFLWKTSVAYRDAINLQKRSNKMSNAMTPMRVARGISQSSVNR